MASSSCSLLPILSSLTFLLALSLPLTSNSLDADQVTKQVCHVTGFPITCETCVHSDPNSAAADTPLAVASFMVSCLRSRSSVLAANMSDMVKVATNKTDKANLLGCSRGFAQSVRMLDRVQGSDLKKRRYGDANRSIRLTAEIQLACIYKLKGSKYFEIPSDVGYFMNMCDQLSWGAMRIIDEL